MISIHSRSPELKGKYDVLRNELKKTGAAVEMAESDYSITSTLGWNGGFEWKGKRTELDDPTFNINSVTFEYGKTIGWSFVEGRDFSREFSTDSSGVVINESALKLMALENPVGEILTLNRGDRALLDACEARGVFLRDVASMGNTLGALGFRIAVKDRATNARVLAVIAAEWRALVGSARGG